MGLFASATDYYEKYRKNAPPEVVDYVVTHAPKPHDSLLDLGAGNGAVLAQFLPFYKSAIAVEPEVKMVALGKSRFKNNPVGYLQQPAEKLKLPKDYQTGLVVLCRAFHWMDRPKVLERLRHYVRPDGIIAIMGNHSLWNLDNEISRTAKAVIKEFLGEDRRTVQARFPNPKKTFGDDLKASEFTKVIAREFPTLWSYSLDNFIGYIHSTSFANPAMLGDKLDDFDDELRKRLKPLVKDGQLAQDNVFSVILASRP